MDNNKQIGERIHQRRKACGYTLEKLGELCGVQSSAVSKWEHGNVVNIKRDTVFKLAKALNSTPTYLMCWDLDEKKEFLFEIEQMNLNEQKQKQLLKYAKFISKEGDE